MSEKYEEGEVVLAYHGPMMYLAKVLDVEKKGPKYFVHYNGWNKKWDEWVTPDKIKKDTEENRKFQKDLEKKVKDGLKDKDEKKNPPSIKKSSKGRNGDDEDEASTPGLKRRNTDSSAGGDDFSVNLPDLTIPLAIKKLIVEDHRSVLDLHRIAYIMSPEGKKTVADIFNLFLAQITGSDENASSAKKSGANEDSSEEDNAKPEKSSSSSAKSGSISNEKRKGTLTPKQTKLYREIMESLRSYFDRSFHLFLLYRFERMYFDSFFVERVDDHRGRAWSELCNPIFFLRLIASLPEFLRKSSLPPEDMESLISTLEEFLKWLVKNGKNFFGPDLYGEASDDYISNYEDYESSEDGVLPFMRLSTVFK